MSKIRIRRKTLIAKLYSVDISYLANGKRNRVTVNNVDATDSRGEIENNANLIVQTLRDYQSGRIPKKDLYQRFSIRPTKSDGSILGFHYILPDGEVVYMSFKRCKTKGFPTRVSIRDTREIL